jgi:hypothetical protein
MAGCGRRIAVRAVVAGFAAAIGLTTTAVASQAAANPLQMTLQLGYHNTVKLGEWMPVTIDVTNRGPDVDGTLEVQASNSFGAKGGGPPGGSAIYQMPFSLASGSTKHFRTYLSVDYPGAVEARIVAGGRVIASQQASIGNTVSGLLVGVASDQPSALDAVATVHPGGSAPSVIHLAAADLPDSGLVLRAFDVLAIDDFATDTLTAGQKSALVDYVMQGGSLLLGTGGTWHKTLAGLPSVIVPMQVAGSVVLPAAKALGDVTGIEIATGTLSTGATAWLAEGGHPMLIERPTGSGLVAMATFDWAQGSIATSSAATSLLRQVVIRSTYGSTNSSALNNISIGKGTITNSVATRGGTLSQSLGNLPALDLPAWWLIGALVLAYVLLVGPVNYFVLRAFNRKALAWVTVPAIALVASGGAYGASLITKGTSVLANEIAIVHVQQGWDRAYSEDYTGILAPTRGDYEVALAGRQAMISPIYYFAGNPGDPNLGAMRVNTASDGITLPNMTAFTLRGFATEGITAAPEVIGQAQIVGGQLKGTIKNVSSLSFTDGVVFAGNAYQKIGELGPNGTAAFNLQPMTNTSFSGQPVFMQAYPNNLNCCGAPQGQSSDAERQAEIRTSMLSTLSINNITGITASAAPFVVLWTKQPFQEITVNGGHPRTYVESAVVLNMAVVQIGAGPMPSGVVSGRMIDLDANLTQAGPPGLVLADSGSLTYAFTPALAPGAHLIEVTMSSANPYGAKFAGPNGKSGVKAETWDWGASAWVSVNYQDNGATSIPDSAVNPVTGEIKVKLSSQSQFTAGFLSISGTVK